jgi:hypothetical protein
MRAVVVEALQLRGHAVGLRRECTELVVGRCRDRCLEVVAAEALEASTEARQLSSETEPDP